MKRLPTLLLPLAIAACTATGPGATPQADAPTAAATPLDAAALAAQHWRLDEARDARGAMIDALLVRPELPLQLDFADGRVAVANSCNRMGGSFAINGPAIEFGRFASTMMACTDPKLAALDQEVGSRLQGSLQARLVDAGTLELVTAAGERLLFKGEPTAETRYGGPGERVFLEVAAQTRPCPHPLVADMQCLQVRELHYDDKGLKTGTEGEFQHFYDAIEGYQHQPGIRNVLRVNRYTVANPPADGSSHAYVLDMVVESEDTTR